MKSVGTLILLALFAALPVCADQKDDVPPLKFFQTLHPQRPAASDPSVVADPSALQFNLTRNWHFTFFNLPLLAPFPGARLEDGSNIPNTFDLVGGIPYTNTMPPWLSDRGVEVEREYARIETTTRKGHATLALTSDGSH